MQPTSQNKKRQQGILKPTVLIFFFTQVDLEVRKMEQKNDSRISENSTTELIDTDYHYSIVKLSSLVPEWSIIAVIIYIVIAMLIGLPGNSIVLIVVTKVRRKTSTDWFVIFIAACDFISLSVSGPLYILFLTPDVWSSISSEFICRFHHYIIQCASSQSLLLLTCMGLDRYMKTCKPHSLLFTPKTAFRCCLIVITVSFLFNISHVFVKKINIYGDCVLDSTKATLQISLFGIMLVIAIFCTCSLCIMYGKIAVQIRRRVKVGPSVVTTTAWRNTAKMQRNEIIVLPEGHGNLDDLTHQHAIVKETHAENVTIKYDKNNHSEHVVYTICTKKVTNNQTNQHFYLNSRAGTSLGHQGTENQKRQAKETHQRGDHRLKQVDKTSKTMGAITLVFILSTVVPVVAICIFSTQNDVKKDPIARVVFFGIVRLYLINNFANPLFYMWLSSEFRRRAMRTLRDCKRRF